MSEDNYIDKLYKDSFKGYEIQPKKELDLKKQIKVGSESGVSKLITNKWLLLVSAAAILSILVVILFSPKEDPVKQDKEVLLPSTPQEHIIIDSIVKIDSSGAANSVPLEIKKPKVKPLRLTKKVTGNDTITDSVVDPTPVIIHKTVIKRDTVIEHKKIIKKVAVPNEE